MHVELKPQRKAYKCFYAAYFKSFGNYGCLIAIRRKGNKNYLLGTTFESFVCVQYPLNRQLIKRHGFSGMKSFEA